jgi:hypothetical protein
MDYHRLPAVEIVSLAQYVRTPAVGIPLTALHIVGGMHALAEGVRVGAVALCVGYLLLFQVWRHQPGWG